MLVSLHFKREMLQALACTCASSSAVYGCRYRGSFAISLWNSRSSGSSENSGGKCHRYSDELHRRLVRVPNCRPSSIAAGSDFCVPIVVMNLRGVDDKLFIRPAGTLSERPPWVPEIWRNLELINRYSVLSFGR